MPPVDLHPSIVTDRNELVTQDSLFEQMGSAKKVDDYTNQTSHRTLETLRALKNGSMQSAKSELFVGLKRNRDALGSLF